MVNIGGQGFDIRELVLAAFKCFPDYYRKLVLCESIRSMSTGGVIPPTIRPTAVITHVRFLFLSLRMLFIDSETHTKCSYLPILQSVREITGKSVPVWKWWPSAAYQLLRLYGPERYGGLGDVPNKARHVAEAIGRDVEEVTKEVSLSFQ